MGNKTLKKNSLYNVIYNFVNMLFPLVTSIYVSRVILAEGIGKVAYGQNITSYFIVLASLGLPTYGVREIAKVRNNREQVNKLFTELFVLNAIFTTVSLVLFSGLILSVPRFRSDYTLFFCCGLQLFMSYFSVDWFYQGEEEYGYITIRSIVVKVVCLVAVLFFVKTKDDYILYALISSLAVTFNNIFNVIHARKFVNLDFNELNFKHHFEPLFILALSVFLSTAYSKVDITMLGSISTDNATGLYNNAHKIVNIIITVCTAISAVFLPRFSYYFKHDKAKFQGLIVTGIKILSFLSLPIFVGLIVLSPQFVLLLYGDGFLPAVLTIRIFSILIIVKSFGNLLCYQLVIATGNEKKRLPAYVAAAVLNIVLNGVLIPSMAQNGAAIASVVSEIAVNGIQLFAIKKIIVIPVPVKPLFQGISTSLIMGAIVYAVTLISSNYIIQLIFGMTAGTVMYIILNIVLKNDMTIMGLNLIKTKIRRH